MSLGGEITGIGLIAQNGLGLVTKTTAVLLSGLLAIAPADLQGVADHGIFKDDEVPPLERDMDPCNATIDVNQYLVTAPDKIRAGLLYDLNENRIVWEKNMDSTVAIASLTKIMVALIAMEEVKSGRMHMDSLFVVPKAATLVGGSRINLRAGAKVRMEDLVRAAMIRSGNDAAYTLAHGIAGSEALFVARMNTRAAEMGLDKTRFYNSTGMPIRTVGGIDNHSSAADILILSSSLMRFNSILDFTSRCTDTLCSGTVRVPYLNTNGLVREFNADVDGLKTGFTNNAGYCIVATSKRCDHRLVAVVLGAPTKYDRNTVTAEMLSSYYNSIGLGRLGEDLAELAETPVPVEDSDE